MIKPSKKQKRTLHYIEHDPEATQILYGGAAFGGKTFLGCYWQLYRRILYPDTRGFIGRAELKNLKLTTLRTFFKVWELHWKHLTDTTIRYNQQDSVIYFSNGSEIVLMDIKYYPSDPEFTDLGSLELTDAFVDEAGESTQKAFNILYSRIRHNLINDKPVLLLASNPAPHWLKHTFVMDKDNRPIELPAFRKYIQAKATDNPDKEKVAIYIKTLEKLPLYDRLRLLEGDWSISENDHPFFYEFSNDKHRSTYRLIIDPDEPLWISFDFNLDPTTAILGQKIEGVGLFIYKEYQIKGGTYNLCQELKEWMYHPAGLVVTGDFSGNTGSTVAGTLPGGVYNTDFAIIAQELKISDYQFRSTKKANAKHEYSKRLCNSVFFRLPICISNECKALLTDLQIAQDVNGKLRKDREVFKMDACDAFRYIINAWFPEGFKEITRFENNLVTNITE